MECFISYSIEPKEIISRREMSKDTISEFIENMKM